MDAKEAILQAKQYVADFFADEQISNLGLEEIEFDDAENRWKITIGFSRPLDEKLNSVTKLLTSISEGAPYTRSYKVVTMSDKDNRLISIKNRSGK